MICLLSAISSDRAGGINVSPARCPHSLIVDPRKVKATAPISDMFMLMLQSAREATLSRYVIEWAGKPIRSIKTGFNAALEQSEIEHCTRHDLRRTAGRFIAEAGVPIEEIAQ